MAMEKEKLIDILKVSESELENLSPLPELSKKIKLDTLNPEGPLVSDLEFELGVLSLARKKSLKIQKTKKQKLFFDWLNSQKWKNVSLNEYTPKDDYSTLNARDTHSIKTKLDGQVFDMWITEKPILHRAKVKTKRFLNDLSGLYYTKIKKTFLSLFLLLIILFGLDIYKNELIDSVESWFLSLQKIEQTSDFNELKALTNDARSDFTKSTILLAPLNLFFNNGLWSLEKLELLNNLNKWGKNLVLALDKGFFLASEYERILKEKSPEEVYFTELLKNSKPYTDNIMYYLGSAYENFNDAAYILDKNPDYIPFEMLAKFYNAKSRLDEKVVEFSSIYKDFDSLLGLLWDEKKKTYLFVFQNNDEIRPTGWFMWSMALVDIFKWKIESIEKRDVYSLEFDIKPFTEPAPEWINKLTPTFGLRDANYYASFEDSSNKIKGFINKAWIHIDWVIYINMEALSPFLDSVSGVYLPEINTTFTSDNFSREMSMLVESKLFKTHTTSSPKDILFDFMEDFASKLKEKWDYKEYLKSALDVALSRDFYVYTFNNENSKFINHFQRWFDYTYDDFVHPYYTSISWNKSDRYIERTYKIKSEINSCDIRRTIEVVHFHNFFANEKQEIEKLFYKYQIEDEEYKKHLMFIAWAWENKSYVRVKIPKESINIEWWQVSDFPEYKEVSYYHNTEKSKETFNSISYTLPWIACDEDREFIFYAQPWIGEYWLEFKDKVNEINWKFRWDFKKAY